MDERQKHVYVAELTNSDKGQRIEVCVDSENIDREKMGVGKEDGV